MGGASENIFGRSDELRRLSAAVEDARAGRGRLFTVTGEPGIGKTRLADEVGRIAATRGMPVLWGRCWEAGGAPAYWPWIEIVRGLLERGVLDVGTSDPDLAAALADVARIVPSLARRLTVPALPELDPREARFRLFESLGVVLSHAAASRALVLVVDDAHVADEPSLRLLQFVARTLRDRPLLVLVNARDAAAKPSPEISALLHEIAREGERLVLGRLSRAEVEQWLEGRGLDPAANVDAVHRATEGNPLFVDETVRWLVARPRDAGLAVPDGVRAAISAHLRMLDADARALLELASVLGRTFELPLVARLAERPQAEVELALRGARDVRVIERLEDERYAFSHLLVREELYQDLGPQRRAALHWTIGAHLGALGDEEAAHAAHHLGLGLGLGVADEGRSADRVRKLCDVTLRAARRSTRQLAFEEACALCERALALLPEGSIETAELLLGIGEARIRAGAIPVGQEACVKAAAIADARGDAELRARAALVYGTELIGGRVDPRMVRLLRDAATVLPEGDGPLRARVLARLASALVPSTPEVHMEAERLAVASVEMARRLGDPPTLYAALQWAIPAVGFHVPSVVRGAMVLEMLAHAERLGDAVGSARVLLIDMLHAIERGEPDRDTRMAEFERRLMALRRPHYTWRIPMMRSLLAILDGRFADAQREAGEMARIGEEAELVITRGLFGLLRASAWHALGESPHDPDDESRVAAAIAAAPNMWRFQAWTLALVGRHEEAWASLAQAPRMTHGLPILAPVAETACLLRDRATAEEVYGLLAPEVDRNPLSWGPSGSLCLSPTAVMAGRLAAVLGRNDEAIGLFEKGIAQCVKSRMRPHLAWAERHLAAALLVRGAEGDRERAAAAAARARAAAKSLGMPALERALDADLAPASTRAPVSAPPPRPSAASLVRDGESWVLSCGARSVRLRDGKGVQYLDALLRASGREIHVSQLVGIDEAGDAGAMLDAEAKASYRARVEDLREVLREAESHGDRGRAARAREELEAIGEELARGVGLGGRDRKAASVTERTRINVQRRLRDVLERIEAHDEGLARWLSASLKTGTYCSFVPVGSVE
jgi:hypothetical protein